MLSLHRCSPRLLAQVRYLSDIPATKKRFVADSGTYPVGFRVGCAHAGVKPSNKQFPDVALLESATPCGAAAVFTTNKFQAAPVQVSRQTLQSCAGEGVRGVVANAGCANAVTGQGGLEDAVAMGKAVEALDGGKGNVLVMSTGVIGQRLPMSKILSAIPKAHAALADSHTAWLATARAICTTDTFPKLVSHQFQLPGSDRVYRIAGMTKGAGMIHPNMATLLGIVCTDAPVSAAVLRKLLAHSVPRSFNAITIDGDTSTNDTIALLANGAAGGPKVTAADGEDYRVLQAEVTTFLRALAQLVVRDGEGATKFVTVRVLNSPSHADAQAIASAIATSPLVKTALYGGDANWGRILCAVGYAPGVGADTVLPERTSVQFTGADGEPGLPLLVNGEPVAVDESQAAALLARDEVNIEIDLGGGALGEHGCGGEPGVYWFSDLSHEYVTINGDYRT